MFEETDMTILHSKIDYTSDIYLEQLNHRISSTIRSDLNELHEQLAAINKKALTRVLQESSTNPLLLLLRMNVVELLEFEEFEVEDDPENPVELDRLLESIDRYEESIVSEELDRHQESAAGGTKKDDIESIEKLTSSLQREAIQMGSVVDVERHVSS